MKVFKRIYIEITNECNLTCSFCPMTKRSIETMSIEFYKKILIAIKGHGHYVYLHIKGEPLYHARLKEILEISREYKLKIMLTTNGTLLRENIEILINSKTIRQISISLQSFENLENKEEANRYIEDILFCVKRILKETNIIIELRLWNYEKDINKNEVENKLFLYMISKELNISLFDMQQQGKGSRLLDKLYLSKSLEFKWPNMNMPVIEENGYCYGLRQQIGILVNGDVVPCCLDSNGDMILGNIFQTNFQDIIDSQRAENIVKGFEENRLVESLCQRCGYRQRFNKNHKL